MVGRHLGPPIPGENVLLDPVARTFEDAMYAIVIVNMDPDEVSLAGRRQGPGRRPDAVPGRGESPGSPARSLTSGNEEVVRRVYYGYFRPSPGSRADVTSAGSRVRT
jgi:hypothetical protein